MKTLYSNPLQIENPERPISISRILTIALADFGYPETASLRFCTETNETPPAPTGLTFAEIRSCAERIGLPTATINTALQLLKLAKLTEPVECDNAAEAIQLVSLLIEAGITRFAGHPANCQTLLDYEMTPVSAAFIDRYVNFEKPVLTNIKSTVVNVDNRLHVYCELGETPAAIDLTNDCVELTANIDDQTPESLGFALERLLEAGALDAWFTPIQMKKNRPAIQLSVLARSADESKIAAIILRETSTLGVRVTSYRRYTADRRILTRTTSLGDVRVKQKILDGEIFSEHYEYEDIAALARKLELPIATILNIIHRPVMKERKKGLYK